MAPRIDPAEEARHLEAMRGVGVYDAAWALAKVVSQADVLPEQSRLLFAEMAVRGGPIPKLFPELAGNGAQRVVPVTILNADGVEEVAHIGYLPCNGAYRIIGPGWIRLVNESGISSGDRIDVYTCRRDAEGDGQRCVFFFKS